MRKFNRFFSGLLTLTMLLTLADCPARGMYVVMDGGRATVTTEIGGRGIVAAYDGDGRLLEVGNSISLSESARTVKVMELDEESAAPRSAAMTAERADGILTELYVPEGAMLELDSGVPMAQQGGELTVRADWRGAYTEPRDGVRVYDAIESASFDEHLDIRVDGSADGRDFAFRNCVFSGGVDVRLAHLRDGNLEINGVRVGGAHVFGYDMPYGVYMGMKRDEFEANVTDFAVYPGRWNEETEEPEFSAAPAFRMADTDRYEYEYNDQGGVNIHPTNGGAIDDPYQVRLVMTLRNMITVTYDTLWYKEGQMSIGEFAGRLRGRVDGTLAAVGDTERAAVESVWNEDEYRNEYEDRLDDFAFAVKYGNIKRMEDGEHDESAWIDHCWNVWDDIRYGTAKTILENVYRAAWHDETHTSLPESVKLTDEEGHEWHRDFDTFGHNEIDRMLYALEAVLPQRESEAETLVVKRRGDGWIYVLFDGADDREENRIDANLSALRFAKPLTVEIDGSAIGEWVGFANCSFNGGLTVKAPAAEKRQDGSCPDRFTIMLHNSCSGTVSIIEADADKTTRNEKLLHKTESEFDWEDAEFLLFRNSVGLTDADGMTVDTGTARVGINMSGGSVTVNGVRYSSDDRYDVSTNYSPGWSWDDKEEENQVSGFTYRGFAIGSNYDESDEDSLEKVLTMTGKPTADLSLRGIVDVTGLDAGEHILTADFDRNNWSNSYVTLSDGQTLSVNDNDCGLDLWVNGMWIDRPMAWWDWRDIRIDADTPERWEASVWQWREDGCEDITAELSKETRSNGVTFNNREEGWSEEDERWYPLNGESVRGTQVRLTNGSVTLIYDPVPRGWERPISFGELGGNLLSLLMDTGYEKLEVGGFTVAQYLGEENRKLDSAAVTLLKSIWNERDFENWADPDWRARIAFVLALLPDGISERYNDPGDIIRWDDAKAAFASVLAMLGIEEISFEDNGWQGEYRLSQIGRDELYEQFLNQMPQTETAGDVELTLYCEEDAPPSYTINGVSTVGNEIVARHFTGAVTVCFGGSGQEDWGGELFFRNCTFEEGVVVRAHDAVPYRLDFANSCAGKILLLTTDYGWTQLWNVKGMSITADNGVSFDASAAENRADLNVSRYEVSAEAGNEEERLNFAQLANWDGYVIQLRLNADFLREEELSLTLDGVPLAFDYSGFRDGGEYVVELRRKGGEPWFGEDDLNWKLALALPLSGATLTLAPPPAEWERPARVSDLVDSVLDLLREWEKDGMDDLTEEYREEWDDYLTGKTAETILGKVWHFLTNEDMPGDTIPDEIREDTILSHAQVMELVYVSLEDGALRT